jgi:hypothetical protein
MTLNLSLIYANNVIEDTMNRLKDDNYKLAAMDTIGYIIEAASFLDHDYRTDLLGMTTVQFYFYTNYAIARKIHFKEKAEELIENTIQTTQSEGAAT